MIGRALDAVEDPRLRPMFVRMAIFVVCWDGCALLIGLLLAAFVSGAVFIPFMLAGFAVSGALTFVLPGVRPTRDEIGALAEYGFPVGRLASRKDKP